MQVEWLRGKLPEHGAPVPPPNQPQLAASLVASAVQAQKLHPIQQSQLLDELKGAAFSSTCLVRLQAFICRNICACLSTVVEYMLPMLHVHSILQRASAGRMLLRDCRQIESEDSVPRVSSVRGDLRQDCAVSHPCQLPDVRLSNSISSPHMCCSVHHRCQSLPTSSQTCCCCIVHSVYCVLVLHLRDQANLQAMWHFSAGAVHTDIRSA